jgi:hypothetical protein
MTAPVSDAGTEDSIASMGDGASARARLSPMPTVVVASTNSPKRMGVRIGVALILSHLTPSFAPLYTLREQCPST